MVLEKVDSRRTLAQAEEVGKESVATVKDVLMRHPRYFTRFGETIRGSDLDRSGKDIEVYLGRAAKLPNLDHFSIEVKSGPTGIFMFLANTASRLRTDRVETLGWGAATVEYLLARKRLVVMAGDDIQTETRLMEQYWALHRYWYRRGANENIDLMLRGLFVKFFGIREQELAEAAVKVAMMRKHKNEVS